MESNPIIRRVVQDDLEEIHAGNDAAVPHVNAIPLTGFERFAREAAYFRVADLAGRLAGFLVALTPEAAYDSPNFAWFRDRYDRFVYVDRIVTLEWARRRRVAAALYGDLFMFSAHLAPRVTCEVNVRPANPESRRFHERLGFREVGTQDTEGGRKTVSLMVCDLNHPA